MPADPPLPHTSLSLTRVAKELFLSDWYLRSGAALLDRPHTEALERIAEESRREMEDVFALFREWEASGLGHEADDLEGIRAVMGRDFLDALIKVKQDSADVLQRTALVAPPGYKERLLSLANIDLRHAMELRAIVLRAYPHPDVRLTR